MTKDNNQQPTRRKTDQQTAPAVKPQAGQSHTVWVIVGAVCAIIFVKFLSVFF